MSEISKKTSFRKEMPIFYGILMCIGYYVTLFYDPEDPGRVTTGAVSIDAILTALLVSLLLWCQ